MTDLLKQLDNLLRTTAFTQGECLSCDKGFENHEYNCNTGPNCAAVKMWKQKNQIKDALTKAAARIRELETSNATAFAAGVEAAANVLDAYSEYDAPMCCDGRECGCQGATVHETIKHYIRALSPPTGMVMVPAEYAQTMELLVKRLDEFHDDPAYKAVWATSQLRLGPYKGPQYADELEAARSMIEAATGSKE